MSKSVRQPAKFTDIEGERELEIDARRPDLPGSVFISGPRGFCVEIDRATFVRAVLDELGIVDPLEEMLTYPA